MPRSWKGRAIPLLTLWASVACYRENLYLYLHSFRISRSVLLRMRNGSDKIIEKPKTHVLYSIFFPPRKSCCLCDKVEKYSRARQATDDNLSHAHCMPDNQGYKLTLTICNTYCFSTATMVTWTRLNVTLIHTLPVLLLRHSKMKFTWFQASAAKRKRTGFFRVKVQFEQHMKQSSGQHWTDTNCKDSWQTVL